MIPKTTFIFKPKHSLGKKYLQIIGGKITNFYRFGSLILQPVNVTVIENAAYPSKFHLMFIDKDKFQMYSPIVGLVYNRKKL